MRYAAFLALIVLPLFAADDAVKPPAPPADVAQAPEAPKHVNKQPQRKVSDEDRAALAAAAKQKREIKKLEKEVAEIEKDIAANEADLQRATATGVSNVETSEAKRIARKNITTLKKALKTKQAELEAARAAE